MSTDTATDNPSLNTNMETKRKRKSNVLRTLPTQFQRLPAVIVCMFFSLHQVSISWLEITVILIYCLFILMDTKRSNVTCEQTTDSTVDTKRKRKSNVTNKQTTASTGSLESKASHGLEADLHRHVDLCEKNPGHLKFIPVDQFNIDHLPPGFHDNDLVSYIRAQSDVTVRVSVKYVSERRPETTPGSDKPYPGYRNRGCHMMRVGTGWVCEVDKYPNKYSNNKTCECKECLNSPTPKTLFAHINILTAAHVVYDDLEAAHTTCHLFFDKGATPDVCSSVVTLTGMSYVWSDMESDICEMKYVTHDLDLADRLDKTVKHRNVLYEVVTDTYKTIWSGPERRQLSLEQARREPILTVIVSHPHGCSKQVTLGHSVSRSEEDGCNMSTYTTATCPGSSGACVFMTGQNLDFVCNRLVHCGDTTGLNYGSWESEVNSSLEADLHKDWCHCTKKKDHLKFTPVDQLNVNSLPPDFQISDLVDYIRTVSDNTVRVTLEYVSEWRPDTIPGTDIPYMLSKYRGRHITSKGTGWVSKVNTYPNTYSENNTCKCKECRSSNSPQTRFAHIHILTAAHVVYDDIEAAYTTCHLFFDKGDSPDLCTDVVTLKGMSHVSSDIKKDISEMIYVTHDLDLADKLDMMVNDMYALYKSVSAKCHQISCEQFMCIIVSHPHGCSKQVSLGHYVDIRDVNGCNRYTYTAATCPGSSGAYVSVLGMARDWLWNRRVHTGGNCEDNKQLNYCHSRQ